MGSFNLLTDQNQESWYAGFEIDSMLFLYIQRHTVKLISCFCYLRITNRPYFNNNEHNFVMAQ